MTQDYTIFAVDDEDILRMVIESMLGEKYLVETFESAEDCLMRVNEKRPDLFLLDIGLPGMSGYDLCRKLKQQKATQDIPVIFISSHDQASDILASYDAGGEDYIVKPFNPIILHKQIENQRRIKEDKHGLLGQAQSSEDMAAILLANLDEYAVLIKFLRSLNECHDARALIDSMFRLLKGYHLEAAIQLRLTNKELTVSDAGENRPLEMAVIDNIRNMGRIFEFKSRAAFNFDAITILVNNMPLHDPDFCGRIRDNVLIAAECANAKLQVQRATEENQHSKSTAAELLATMQTLVSNFEKKNREARYQGSTQTQYMLEQLTRAFASLGLSEEQESRIDKIVRHETSKLADIYDSSNDVQLALADIAQRLSKILTPPTSTASAASSQSAQVTSGNSSVENSHSNASALF